MQRKKGGEMPKTTDEEGREELKASETPERKRGGKMPHHARKRGGHVPGHAAMSRPDRKARASGGAADLHPMSSAGKMSTPSYERRTAPADDHGAGPDRD